MKTLTIGDVTYEIVDEHARNNIKNLPISKTENGGVIILDGNIANGNYSVASGKNTTAVGIASNSEGYTTQAGSKVFTILAVNAATKTYTLNTVEGLQKGDVFSVHLQYEENGELSSSQGENYGKIKSIDTVNNNVTVDKFFCEKPFHFIGNTLENYQNEDGYDDEYNTFRIIAKPTIPKSKSKEEDPTGLTRRYIGCSTHSEGKNTKALSKGAHAEGKDTVAYGSYAHVEGHSTKAGYCAHAEGRGTNASGFWSHAEGRNTVSSGEYSHAEGFSTSSSGKMSHAEGYDTTASGTYAHAEGYSTVAKGIGAHAEGKATQANGDRSHAEGNECKAMANNSHAQNYMTVASGMNSHAEGASSTSSGDATHAEGYETLASGFVAHAEGHGTIASGKYQHVQGKFNLEDSTYAHIVGNGTNKTTRSNAHTIDWDGNAWFAGDVKAGDVSLQKLSTTFKYNEETKGISFNAYDTNTTNGENATTFGNGNTASGAQAFVVGKDNIATHPKSSVVSGQNNIVKANHGVVSGFGNQVYGHCGYAEGNGNVVGKSSLQDDRDIGMMSHAEGKGNVVTGTWAHVQGYFNLCSSDCQDVMGKYNVEDTKNKYAQIVGNGYTYTDSDTKKEVVVRSNAYTLDWNGNAWYQGTVEATGIILKSSTEGSEKRFKITVNDDGILSATELI